ncbi:hypothetical protein ACNKHN_00325 [Shigella flexneri]
MMFDLPFNPDLLEQRIRSSLGLQSVRRTIFRSMCLIWKRLELGAGARYYEVPDGSQYTCPTSTIDQSVYNYLINHLASPDETLATI